MKIKTKLQIVTVLSLTVALVIGAILFFSAHQVNDAIKKDRAADEIIRGLFELNILTNEYLMHHEERTKTQWQIKHDSIKRFLEEVEVKNPEKIVLLKRMRENHESIKTTFSQMVLNYEGYQDVEGSISQELNEMLVGNLDVKSRSMVSDAYRLAEISSTKVAASQQRAYLLVVLFALIMAMVVTGVSFLINRSVVKPVRKLHEGTEIIGAGDLTYKVGTMAKDEVGQLSRAFDQMTNELKESFAGLEKEIAERKRAEEALEGLARFPSENPNPVLRIGRDGTLLYANEASYAILRDWQLDTGRQAPLVLREAASQTLTQQVGKIIDTEHGQRTISFFVAPVVNAGYANFYGRDITERKQAEEALRESDETARALLNATSDSVFLIDPYGTVLALNEITAKRLNKTVNEMVGSYLYDSLSSEVAKRRTVYLDEAFRTGKPIYFEDERQGIWFDTCAYPILDTAGKVTKLAIYARDITERKQAEEELRKHREHLEELVEERTAELRMTNEQLQQEIIERKRAEESRAQLAAIVESSDDAIIGKTLDGTILSWNSGAEKLYGYSPQEVQGRPISTLIPPDRPNEVPMILARIERGESSKHYETTRMRKDGRKIYVSLTTSPIKDMAGNIIGASTIARDISERKRAEEEIKKLNQELKYQIMQLEAANKELEAFSYSVSHDLRAPLRAIDGFSRIILEDYMDKLDDEGKRFLNTIRNNTQKMGQLIDDLLVFSRLGRQEIRVSEMDMGKLAKAVSDELKVTVPERKIDFTIKRLSPTHGDQSMIRQVFANLLSNAIKFTGPREIAGIEVGDWSEGDENIYYVKDNGVGFDMQYVHKLFAVFQRLHSSEEFEGTGVGLAIVQRIIHRHGGRVWAEGKVDEGATFYFSLPAK